MLFPLASVFSVLISTFEGLEGLVLLLFILGIVLVVIEFLMPGFGIAGILGVVSLVAGIVLVSQLVSILVLILIIAAVLVIIAGLLVFMYKSATKGGRMSKLLLLNTNTSKEEGFTSTKDIEEDLVGLEGIAETILRPAGIGLFGKRKIDVVTEGEFIQRGSKIKIVKIEGFRIIVEEIE